MKEFELKLRIAPSDSQFKKLIGIEKYNEIKLATFQEDKFTCQGCGYKPLDESKAFTALSLHVLELNEENPEKSEFNILCKACHSTQHIDISLEKGWVLLVNSTFSQKSLIEMCRTNATLNSINEDNTRYLKTTSSDFIEKVKNGTLPESSKAKVLFTSTFEWGDL